MNALCHRDYSESGASVGVSIYDDRLEVWSWGRLPSELTPEKLRVDHPSIRRNDLIADVFYRRGYIEKWGRGTQKILEACHAAGLREPELIERAGEVGVRFWAGAGAGTEVGEHDLTPRQREVLNAVAALGETGVEEIRRRLQSPPSARMVQRLLATLVGGGRVSRIGKGRSTRYRLAESRRQVRDGFAIVRGGFAKGRAPGTAEAPAAPSPARGPVTARRRPRPVRARRLPASSPRRCLAGPAGRRALSSGPFPSHPVAADPSRCCRFHCGGNAGRRLGRTRNGVG